MIRSTDEETMWKATALTFWTSAAFCYRWVDCHARKRAAAHSKLELDEIENWHHLTWKHSSHGLQVHMRAASFGLQNDERVIHGTS